MMKDYKLGLFIGRFQPFHKGHWFSFQKTMEVADRVVIGIGSSNKSRTSNNPWNYKERKQMIEEVLVREPSHAYRQVKIVGIPDYESDDEWVDQVLRLTGGDKYRSNEVVVVGNNQWTNKVLAKSGISVLESGLYDRDELEGVKIREMMLKNDVVWKERVLPAVADFISTQNYLAHLSI